MVTWTESPTEVRTTLTLMRDMALAKRNELPLLLLLLLLLALMMLIGPLNGADTAGNAGAGAGAGAAGSTYCTSSAGIH